MAKKNKGNKLSRDRLKAGREKFRTEIRTEISKK